MVRPRLSFGPCLPENGSWTWIGQDLASKSHQFFDVCYWIEDLPRADVLVIVKFPPDSSRLSKVGNSTKIVYFPVDFFVSPEHIASYSDFLRRCDQVIVSSPRQFAYFEPFTSVEYLDHHVKYAIPDRVGPLKGGDFLWVGVHTNLLPLVEWVEKHPLPRELSVLTNYGDGVTVDPNVKRFLTRQDVSFREWSPSVFKASLRDCFAALDIKGQDFASLNKPATKAIDFIASGVPFAMNQDSSSVEYFRSLGFSIADPEDRDRWLSEKYLRETQRMGIVLREAMSLDRVSHRFHGIITDMLGKSGSSPNAENSVLLKDASPKSTWVCDDLQFDSSTTLSGDSSLQSLSLETNVDIEKPVRVAIISFLFNWPSTGGGIVHTVELASFLQRDGYEVVHFYAQNSDWGIGQVTGHLTHTALPISIPSNASKEAIQKVFRSAVGEFNPDYVIVTDSWNMKPVIADAMSDYRYMLRFQALECLCPLNNVRFLPMENGKFAQCGKHQLATPSDCQKCVRSLGRLSGGLHQLERGLAGVGSREYDALLRRVVENAYAVLVVNPEMAMMFSPYNDNVRVAPSGFDLERFPWPPPQDTELRDRSKTRLLFAGLVDEWIKGFPYLHQACSDLWQSRQDFELLVTADPIGQRDPFTRHIGWQSQESLPRHIYSSDILVVPTIAQEALGRTAVEAMAAGKPVIASRLGGLKSTVLEGCTGLLAEPGDPASIREQIVRLLDDSKLRHRLGVAARERFEQEFTWQSILDRHYRPLMPKSTQIELTGSTR